MKITWFVLFSTLATYLAGNPAALWLWPAGDPNFQPWQLLTYAWSHGGALHLAINLLALLSFAPALERTWGSAYFAMFYALCAICAGLAQWAFAGDAPLLGASGALFGVFAAYVHLRPTRRVLSLIPWPTPAWQLLTLYMLGSVMAQLAGWLQGVAHVAHLAGAAVGMLLAVIARNNKAPE